MYNPKGTPEERDLNLQMHSFFVVKFNSNTGEYEQFSIRMSLENAHNVCVDLRKNDRISDYKVFGELENF